MDGTLTSMKLAVLLNPGCGQVCTEVCGCCGCAYGAVCNSECDASSD